MVSSTANAEVVVLVTTSSVDEGARIATAVVDERLAACVNIVPGVRSIYRFEGKVCDDSEAILVVKTVRECLSALEARVKVLHSYSVPEFIVLPIVDGSADYLAWLQGETRPPKPGPTS